MIALNHNKDEKCYCILSYSFNVTKLCFRKGNLYDFLINGIISIFIGFTRHEKNTREKKKLFVT